VGLCARQNAKRHLDSFVGKLKASGRIRDDRKISEVYGIIPVYKPSIKTQYDRIVTVGDAAGQVKASTGGGIIFGGLAAETACSGNYEREWRSRIGDELKLHLMLHKFLARLKPKSIDRLLRLVGRYHADLERGGDMDYASKTFRSLLLDPKFTADFLVNAPLFLMDLI
jgi:flavin-dependent dehydrogenase